MLDSLRNINLVHQDLLQERIETIHELKELDNESYLIVKDRVTGEHYVHYAYRHINIAGTGEEEYYHQLLPIESDDVLTIMFEEAAYEYPDHWHHSFLRNGPEEGYVWFDPSAGDEFERMEAAGQQIAGRLKAFKERGAMDPESVRKLLEDLDRL